MSTSGNMIPQSTTRIRPSTSRQKQFRPISPRPPRKTMRTSGDGVMVRPKISGWSASLVDDAGGHRPQVLDDPDLGEHPKPVVRRVDLPPAEPLAGGALVAVV